MIALALKKTDGGDTLPWSNIVGFGADAVTVSDADQIGDASRQVDALSGKDRALLGKRVLSTSGDELGKVDDVEFDPASGRVTTLLGPTGRYRRGPAGRDRLLRRRRPSAVALA